MGRVPCAGRLSTGSYLSPRSLSRRPCTAQPVALTTFTGFRQLSCVDLGSSYRGCSLSAAVQSAGSRRRGSVNRRAPTRMMFERFTEKAIKVVMLAQEEARRLGHNFVGTEQILLGLIGESTGIAAKVRLLLCTSHLLPMPNNVSEDHFRNLDRPTSMFSKYHFAVVDHLMADLPVGLSDCHPARCSSLWASTSRRRAWRRRKSSAGAQALWPWRFPSPHVPSASWSSLWRKPGSSVCLSIPSTPSAYADDLGLVS